MKKNFILIFFLLSISNLTFETDNCMCQWVQTNGPPGGGTVYALTAQNNNIFAGTTYGVYLTTDNGNNWSQVFNSPSAVFSLKFSGINLLAGTSSNGIYFSSNNGGNWTQSLSNQSVEAIASNGSYAFAGVGYNGVCVSTNNGQGWLQTPLNNKLIWSLLISGNNVFAGTGGYGVYISTNNGTTWSPTSLTNKVIYSLAISGFHIFAGTMSDGIYLSTNSGMNWTQTTLNYVGIYSLADSGNKIFAGTSGNGIFFSLKNDTTWIPINEGFQSSASVHSLIISGEYLFAGTWIYGVWRRPLSEIIGVKNISCEIPNGYKLEQNYPNPFNPETTIKYSLPKACFVCLKIFDALGRETETLVNEKQTEGIYSVTFNGRNYSSGIYYCRLNAGRFSDIKKLVLIK